jgi:hypothetical protein
MMHLHFDGTAKLSLYKIGPVNAANNRNVDDASHWISGLP